MHACMHTHTCTHTHAHMHTPPSYLQVTLYTRGKKAVAAQIPDDAAEGYAKFKSKIKHIAGDRMVRNACMS